MAVAAESYRIVIGRNLQAGIYPYNELRKPHLLFIAYARGNKSWQVQHCTHKPLSAGRERCVDELCSPIGHARQSRMLGWLYLLVIGLPSIVWAALYGWLIPRCENGYYKFYTEKWADKLAGINR